MLYRLQQDNSTAGLWYDRDGTFNNRIVSDPSFAFLNARQIPMGHDDDCQGGWLSCVDDLDKLAQWFDPDEMRVLQGLGFHVFGYQPDEVGDVKWYAPYQHHLIRDTCKRVVKIEYI